MKRTGEKLTIWYSWTCGLILSAAVFSILAYLVFKGAGTLNMKLIFGDASPLRAVFLQQRVFEGLFPAIVGTFILVALSIAFALPIGFATGIYLAEYADFRVKNAFNLIFDILAGIPSIVVGLFGFALAVFLHKHYSSSIQPCLLISSLALAFLVLPYIIRTTQIALEGLSPDTRLTALALGATKLQNLFYVLIPQSLSGMVSGLILAIGRCAEDTAVIMLTGVVVAAGVPKSALAPYEALPFYIYYISSQYTSPEELMNGYGAALILLLLCLFLFTLAFVIKKRLTYLAFYRP
ncbi:phosphate ABC transporter permease PstA [Syntrophus aciditrophicus]|uniref:Phosphate transport system permease protein PstA n=1 Tax=Syntrophus aciditrophicus (strain SB) TaxID=56780 RepID=Q2LYD4_SYNAS|nr:phosphate ABC transporter permease PstA [Syntrophus aciditrophicus]ABC76008.1 phosphate uptake ABC transporter [Syntrophus aciditrophicus SB]OPY14707.1 MAG: Phosphate transport system permease protein PstA [Syntrophus sp. PtaB.Bin075]